MSWIKTISFEEASGPLKKLYDRVVGPNNNVDNILMVHSLRPHTLQGHMALYKNVIHNANNMVPKSFLETLGVYVSMLNKCVYCTEHHFAGLKRLLNDDDKASLIRKSFEEDNLQEVFDNKEHSSLKYARKLTLCPHLLSHQDVDEMRDEGWDDGEILEINQVVSYFNYANRTVNGLGVTTDGDILGLSPNDSDDPDNWGHS